MADITTYELTMTTDYVQHWGEWEAVREVLQNAIDYGDPVINRALSGLQIISKGVTLDPKTLLLGSTTKRNDDDSIGQFGEGYKLACLVLCRLGIDILIQNGSKIWIPSIRYSEKYGCDLLVIDESDGIESGDLIFNIGSSIDLTDKYLPDVEPNEILEDRPGQIFVAGLFVCELPKFDYGYNFSPNTLKLGRDRTMVSNFDVTYETGKLWNLSGRADEVYDMLESEVKDVEYLDSNAYTVGPKIAEIYASKYGSTIPVTTQEDITAVEGQAYQVVPSRLRKIIKRFKTFVVKIFSTPLKRLESWEKRWKYNLPADAVTELDSIIKQMGGRKDED